MNVAPQIRDAAFRECEEDRKAIAVCLRLPENQGYLLQVHARSAGIERPELIRRIVREWIVAHF